MTRRKPWEGQRSQRLAEVGPLLEDALGFVSREDREVIVLIVVVCSCYFHWWEKLNGFYNPSSCLFYMNASIEEAFYCPWTSEVEKVSKRGHPGRRYVSKVSPDALRSNVQSSFWAMKPL